MVFRIMVRASVVCLAVMAGMALQAAAQSGKLGRWADAKDPVAQQLIEAERKWAVLECEPSDVVRQALAEDFVGTSPAGPIYDKKEALKDDAEPVKARDCKLLSAKVRFYGPELAILYGKETSTRIGKDGKEFQRTLIWMDTWLKRDGKWQIIAVQDMKDPSEK